jgi:Fe-S-cluster containining protein
MTDVPCNGCRACCQGGHDVVLMPPDDIGLYMDHIVVSEAAPFLVDSLTRASRNEALWSVEDLAPHLTPEALAEARAKNITTAVLKLGHRENGDCAYLGESGCTIHENRPTVCRQFDCRTMFLSMTRAERRAWIKSGNMSKEVFQAGRERLDTLES